MTPAEKHEHEYLLAHGWGYEEGVYFEPGNGWPDGMTLREAIGVQRENESFKFSIGDQP